MAKNRLERMPCGGGSPLAHALNQAATTGLNAQKSGDVGEVLVICISDGRANVPLANADGEVDPKRPGDLLVEFQNIFFFGRLGIYVRPERRCSLLQALSRSHGVLGPTLWKGDLSAKL